MCRFARHQPQYSAQENIRSRYTGDTAPQIDVKTPQKRGDPVSVPGPTTTCGGSPRERYIKVRAAGGFPVTKPTLFGVQQVAPDATCKKRRGPGACGAGTHPGAGDVRVAWHARQGANRQRAAIRASGRPRLRAGYRNAGSGPGGTDHCRPPGQIGRVPPASSADRRVCASRPDPRRHHGGLCGHHGEHRSGGLVFRPGQPCCRKLARGGRGL